MDERTIEELQAIWWQEHLPRKMIFGPGRNDCGDLQASYWHGIEKGARKRNLPFAIDMEYGWKLFLRQKGRCALSGRLLVLRRTATEERTASLDRIDSRAGYIEGNVQWIERTLNFMKMDLTQEALFDLIEDVYYHSIRPNRPERPLASSWQEDELG